MRVAVHKQPFAVFGWTDVDRTLLPHKHIRPNAQNGIKSIFSIL